MTQEQIEKEAEDYSYKNWSGGGFGYASREGFVSGANWRINSVWHTISEKPDFSNLPILLEHNKGQHHFMDDTPSSWHYVEKYYSRWAYVKDLIPEKK